MGKNTSKKRFSLKGKFSKSKGRTSKTGPEATLNNTTGGTLPAVPIDADVPTSPTDTDIMSVINEEPIQNGLSGVVTAAQANTTCPGSARDASQRAESSSPMDVDGSTREVASCEPSGILEQEANRAYALESPGTQRGNGISIGHGETTQRDLGMGGPAASGPRPANAIDVLKTAPVPLVDVADRIPGLYRILDLVNEQSSGGGGLVDKIIISQQSFGRFVNDVCPGAYQSMTNVNFRFLDTAQIKPLGVYGSRSEIIKYLRDMSLIDDEATKLLTQSKDEMPAWQALRAGMYLLRSLNSDLVHVLFWPQDTTWDDNAISSVQRNRITFMRYLSKIADQIVVLVSSVHANAIVWNEQEITDKAEDSDDEADRLFTFEVVKTREQEENVTPLPGFEIRDLPIDEIEVPEDPDITPEMLAPQLVAGETNVGFMTVGYEPARDTQFTKNDSYTALSLRDFITKGSFRLSESLSESALQILITNGLDISAKEECVALREARSTANGRLGENRREVLEKLDQDIKDQRSKLEVALRLELVDLVASTFEVFSQEKFVTEKTTSSAEAADNVTIDEDEARLLLQNLTAMHPELQTWRELVVSESKFMQSVGKTFKDMKEKILKENSSLAEQLKSMPTPPLTVDQDANESKPSWSSALKDGVKAAGERIVAYMPGNVFPEEIPSRNSRSKSMPDPVFLARIPVIMSAHPELAPQLTESIDAARKHFIAQLVTVTHKAVFKIENTRRRACEAQLNVFRDKTVKEEEEKSRQVLLQAVDTRFLRKDREFFLVDDVQKHSSFHSMYDSYRVTGLKHCRNDASLRYTIRSLQVTTEDKHAIQLDPSHVPAPRSSESSSFHFQLPAQHNIVYAHFVQDSMFLLVTSFRKNVFVYLERLLDLDSAVRNSRYKKQFRSDKLGDNLLLSYDESKRMLAVCAVDKLQIHVFIFDERYRTLQGLGAVVDLKPWYDQQSVITHILFRCGPDEELLVVDGLDAARARIWSLTSQQFRPAALMLPRPPYCIISSPDGSCFFTVEIDGRVMLQAYHWASFGSTQGIFIELPDMPMDSVAMCSLVNRSHPYFAALDYSSRQIRSTGFHITHKSTEFTFKADRLEGTHRGSSQMTAHNSLLDVHRDVWIRFPVVPAVRRHTFKSSHRLPHSLTFVSSIPSHVISQYYSELILTFEKSTRKPTEGELANTIVSGVTYTAFMKERARDLSSFKAGEWLVDILCLIPIHIAVARDNRFVPLRDGVLTPEFERSLLGATVEQVVDKLSFGWYESIFQSYMASKPVQVVSSMGEQSVGKSFALNHLVDTSFAGSAMRTTEGVWMSVTPTDDTLIVALDFEGVHSLERSAQEDSLLVLFNTAISNLVLFRNNFAFSRDISGLFQSFQSSATVLDPAANPSLFKSLLVIIIKDVVDSDKNEITKEFSLKFQQIVASEQESNFISRLHGGKLAIIPWPVIESRQFYTLFQTVKKRLDNQPITHPKAGIFLQTLKTLMAKLKTNDWGSLDQNLATHRAQHLQALLPIALQFGGSESEPDFEPLKDIDNGVPLDVPNVLFKFCLPAPQAPEGSDKSHMFLKKLQASWSRFPERQLDGNHELWTNELDEYLASLAADRIEYVRQWLEINTARFSSDTTTFEGLRREFGSLGVALRSTVQLCKLQCADCQLLCLKTRHHQGPHGCDTDHRCMHSCAFTEEHQGMETMCGLPAGHPGQHICDISLHLCGQPCDLYGKTGCLEQCSKIANHEDGKHMCPAPLHECGMACSLREIQLHDGSTYSCEEKCHIPSDQDHTEHVCKQQSCPLTCQLCRRLCSEPLHLHGLDNGARHLCGQEHPCGALCQSRGICRIETAPQSVEVTFSGRHDTFQYTKYSQESKRLPCVVTIPSGETEHVGDHVHAMDPKNFHFCQTRCQSCGYFCTLPLDHAQQEHETSHGSMSQTKWAVEGADTSVIEVNGRRFGANDDGAPLLCSMICQELGRHAHIDYCRTQPGEDCSGNGLDHIRTRMLPQPERPKDFISHELHWRRTGFKDPYPHEDRDEFAKCDRMCAGQEHQRDPNLNNPAQPSFCGLPIFHAELIPGDPVPGGIGYISGDGHHFSCRNPALLQQAFHVMFVIDRSGSMDGSDRRPLSGTPVTNRIVRSHNNRIGAVYSSLYSFWSARHNAINGAGNRRDAYSVILFDDTGYTPVTNNFTSTPDELLNLVLPHGARGGTDYNLALRQVQACMTTNWSTERSPVIIFLSDGLCGVQESNVRDLCRGAIALGRALSFHTVSFGPHNEVLRRMAEIALDVQRTAPADPMRPALPSSYVEALDSVRLAETFLGIADSLAKPRGALMHA